MGEMLLVLNVGSSTVKYAVFDWDDLNEVSRSKVICSSDKSGDAICDILQEIGNPSFIVHRIVHGGQTHVTAQILNDGDLNILESYSQFAPRHQPYNIHGIRIAQGIVPHAVQVGCFDTAFHARHTEDVASYALPKTIRDMGYRRYGFHGLSYEWVASQIKSPRIVAAHLGSGASLCAIMDGQSVDTTMGLTALDGVPMATRSGSIDPGLILSLMHKHGMSPDTIQDMLYTQSGMLGLSGVSGDFKTLLESDSEMAHLAISHFVLKVSQGAASMAVSMGGMDTLVFTGGVGENSAVIRDSVCKKLDFLRPFDVRVVPANEEYVMAMQCKRLIQNA